MDSTRQAQCLLLAYLLGIMVCVGWRMIRSPMGWPRWLLYAVARLYCGLAFHWRSNRRCPYPSRGGGLVVANHRSPLDPILLWSNNHLRSESGMPRGITFLMASEYYTVPAVGWICRAMQSIPVDRNGRDMKATREALRYLSGGGLLGVFPEGHLNPTDELQPGNPGVAYLALKARVPVFPVFIHNSPRGYTMVKPFYTFQRVWIEFGEPLDLSQWHARGMDRAVLQEVTDLMMERIRDLGRQAQSRFDSLQ